MIKFLIYFGIGFFIAFLLNIFINYDNYILILNLTNDFGKAIKELLLSNKSVMIYITITLICTLCLYGIEKTIYYGIQKKENKTENEK